MRIRAIIIEDEEPARSLIKEYLQGIPEVELCGEFADGFSGLKGIQDLKPDLIFLDVQMPKLTGFELLELLDGPPRIIFTTAYDQYAIKAFEQNAVDYLLKPFSRERFAEALSKVSERSAEHIKTGLKPLREHIEDTTEVLSRIVVRSRNEIRVIPAEKILFLEAQGDYVMIHTAEGKYMKQKTMKYFEEHLNREEFLRVHRSYIIRVDQVNKLEPWEKYSWLAILKNGQKIPVSKSGYRELKDLFDF